MADGWGQRRGAWRLTEGTTAFAGIFWRFDMESYAANRHNEDRSQHVVDSISDHKAGAQKPVFFCACYDGHGGEEAVDFVQQFLYANIRSHLDTGAEPVAHAIISVRCLCDLSCTVALAVGLTLSISGRCRASKTRTRSLCDAASSSSRADRGPLALVRGLLCLFESLWC